MQGLTMFNDYMLAKNLADSTRQNYLNDVEQFFSIISKTVTKVVRNDVLRFVNEKLKTNAPTTTNRKLSAIKTFFKVMEINGMIKENPARLVENAKTEKKLPRVVDLDDVYRLIEIADNARDKLIFEILFSTGVRREELVNIKISDVSFTRGFIKVMGKGSKERMVVVNKIALQHMEEYTKQHTSMWVFPSSKVKNEHISTRRLNEIVKYWTEQIGLKNINCHRFRATFCTELYRVGADIKSIQDLVGHVSINTTNMYTKTNMDRNMAEYNKLFKD